MSYLHVGTRSGNVNNEYKKIYLIYHQPLNDPSGHSPLDVSSKIRMGWSRLISNKIITDFRNATYNDFVAGELFNTEQIVKHYVYADEYYLVLQVPSEAIAYVLADGHVFIHAGYTPKILLLKTGDQKVFFYNDVKGFYTGAPQITASLQKTYNYNPERWYRYNHFNNMAVSCK